MILFGHRFIKSESFYYIQSISSVVKTPANSFVYVQFSEKNLDIIDHLLKNGVRFAVNVQNITEIIYANALGASYICVPFKLAQDAQKIANEYLFDAKVLAHITEEEEIEELAYQGVDGALFPKAIIKISS